MTAMEKQSTDTAHGCLDAYCTGYYEETDVDGLMRCNTCGDDYWRTQLVESNSLLNRLAAGLPMTREEEEEWAVDEPVGKTLYEVFIGGTSHSLINKLVVIHIAGANECSWGHSENCRLDEVDVNFVHFHTWCDDDDEAGAYCTMLPVARVAEIHEAR